MGRYSLHICALDRECRRVGADCWRIQVKTPKWFFSMALTPMDRFIGPHDKLRWISVTQRGGTS